MDIKYLVEIKVTNKPNLYRAINGFPKHEGDKVTDVREGVVTIYINNWHLHEDQVTFLLSRKQKKVLTYQAWPVPGPSIAKDKVKEYRLVSIAS